MLPSRHFIVTLLTFLIAYPFLKFEALWLFLGGFLIDVDHYLFYIYKFKNFNLYKAYRYNKDKIRPKGELDIFHTIEFWIIILFLSAFYKFMIIFSIGYFIHMWMDFIEMYRKKIYNGRPFSLVLYLVNKQD